MDCPYCKKELIPGFIYGGGYGVEREMRWLPETEKPTLEALALDSEKLSKGNYLSQPRVKSYKCSSCRKLIIDLDE